MATITGNGSARPHRGLLPDEAGFTLVEALLTLAIMGVVVAAFVFFQSAGVQLFTVGSQQADLEQTVRFALDYQTRELRQATSPSVSPDGTRVSYTDRNGQQASFYYDAPSGELRQDVNGGTPPERVIAQGITAVSYQLVTGPTPLFTVSVTAAEGSGTQTATSLVAVRVP